MTNPQKSKGDKAERELAALLDALIGGGVRRKLGAGRSDDTGDIHGVPDTVVEVKSYADVAAGISSAMAGLDVKRINAGATHAVAFIRRPGGEWLAVMTPDQWATYHREAAA